MNDVLCIFFRPSAPPVIHSLSWRADLARAGSGHCTICEAHPGELHCRGFPCTGSLERLADVRDPAVRAWFERDRAEGRVRV